MKINKIIGAFNNIDQILEGVKNKIFKKKDIEEIADVRWLQCVVCPELDEKGDKCAVSVIAPCCGACGCSIGLKIRALSASCPKGRWEAVVDAKGEKLIKDQINKKDASNI
jgi:hypothetical protein